MAYLYWVDKVWPVVAVGVPPKDAIELTSEQEQEILAAISRGGKVLPDGEGWAIEDQAAEELAAQAKAARIAELRRLLADTDYVALSDYDKSKPEVLAQRQAWRDEIRELES